MKKFYVQKINLLTFKLDNLVQKCRLFSTKIQIWRITQLIKYKNNNPPFGISNIFIPKQKRSYLPHKIRPKFNKFFEVSIFLFDPKSAGQIWWHVVRSSLLSWDIHEPQKSIFRSIWSVELKIGMAIKPLKEPNKQLYWTDALLP